MTAFLRTRLVAIALAIAGIALATLALAIGLLRFDLDKLLIPATATDPGQPPPAEAFRLPGHGGAWMVVRRFDPPPSRGAQGCVVYFPGHEGGPARHARELFADLGRAGLTVYAVAYPGQDDPPGMARIDDVPSLATAAVSRVIATCGRTRTVVAGRSLGAMVAAYASATTSPAGLVIESTAPTLSAGIRGSLRAHWILRPLAWLPIERIVPHDFSLAEAIPAPSRLHVVIFQGSADTRTPLADLLAAGVDAPVVVVRDGTHADTLARARPAMVATMLDMIRGSQAAAARGVDND